MIKVKKKKVKKHKLIIYKDKIIKVQHETEKDYIGFDIFSENLFSINKNTNAIEMPEVVIKLVGCEASRLKLANAICKNYKELSQMISMSERSIFRQYVKHNMWSDEQLREQEKIRKRIKK